MVPNQTRSLSGATSRTQKTETLTEGDRLQLPDGQILTIEDVDRRDGRPDRFDIAEVASREDYSHREYDLRRAIEGGAEVLTR